MSRRFSLKSEPVFFRVGVILVVVVAMVSTVFIVFPGPDAHGTSFRAVATVKAPEAGQPILAEAGAFRDLLIDEFIADFIHRIQGRRS